ncbi:MAG TPA: hypothetical protein VNX18_24185 [Bryobacteraceae bacterium]|nr:hypothetical protein [Bryobacteraceae bacterium]
MKMLMGVALLAITAAGQTPAAQTKNADPWKPFQFLMGEWVGEGGGGPGQGGGGFSLQFDLQRQVLVRKNFADYPAQDGRPAVHHEDLMIIYLDDRSKSPRAIYFDSEGHTIRYTVAPARGGLVFESEAGEPGPHYRLSYTPSDQRVNGKFELSAPGQSEYKTYLDFSAHRK